MIARERSERRPTIVLLHDVWVSHRCFEHWIAYFRQRGYVALAPAWPGVNVDVDVLRRDPTPMAELSIAELAAHYAEYIRFLRGPVILMGHGLGGLLVQLLVDRGLGDAGVLIASTPTAGVVGFPRSALLARGRGVQRQHPDCDVVTMTPDRFQHQIVNGMDRVNGRATYERYHVPAPSRLLWELAFAPLNPWAATQVNYRNEYRAPLLFLAGGADRMVPASISRRNAAKYAPGEAITSFREWPNRGHFMIGEAGWAEVADYALNWSLCHVTSHVTSQVTVHTPLARLQTIG